MDTNSEQKKSCGKMEIEVKFIRDGSQLASRDLHIMASVVSALEDLLAQSEPESMLAVRISNKSDLGIKIPGNLDPDYGSMK